MKTYKIRKQSKHQHKSKNLVGTLEEKFDVIVVGAGPAGSSAARKCSDYGLKTILIEKQSIPRLKPCGGGVSLKALKLIGHELPAELIEQHVRGFRFFSPSLDSVDLVAQEKIGVSVCRDKFDAFLTQLSVKSGCKLIQADGVVDLTIEKEGVVCKLSSGKTINGSIIIGADGANSVVAKKTGIRQKWASNEVGLCLESDIPLDITYMEKLDLDILELYFIDIPFGYGWLFPKKSSISLGIGGELSCLQYPQNIFREFCNTVSKLKNIDLGTPKFKAHLTPAGGINRKVVADRTMLAGDAAGFIDPFTGEGIYYAIRSGQIAADACKKAVEEHTNNRVFFEKNYQKVCDDDFVKDLKVALKITGLVHSHFNTFFNALRKSSGTSMTELSTGSTNYRTLEKKLLPKLVFSVLSSKLRFRNEGKRNEEDNT
jgi:geranylgeranyl reductase family protein